MLIGANATAPKSESREPAYVLALHPHPLAIMRRALDVGVSRIGRTKTIRGQWGLVACACTKYAAGARETYTKCSREARARVLLNPSRNDLTCCAQVWRSLG